MREKPFFATLTDPTRTFIEGHAGSEYYRLYRGVPQKVSYAVASALRETLYEVKIEGTEPAVEQIAAAKQKEATNGSTGNGSKQQPAAGAKAKAGSSGKKKAAAEKGQTAKAADPTPTESTTGTETGTAGGENDHA